MTRWIAGITRGHNAGVCLLRDGEIIFSIEEERLSRQKYDGGPFAAMKKILDYTDKLDYLVIAHTQPLKETAGKVDFSGDDIYTGFARKLKLISHKERHDNHPQVLDYSYMHHQLHAACAFYRSGFDEAVAVIVDGAGTYIPLQIGDTTEMTWELETFFTCKYPNDFKTIYKHQGGRGPWGGVRMPNFVADYMNQDHPFELILDDSAGIVKAYEAVTQYCGWAPIEAGKTMGLFPYGNPNNNFPAIYSDGGNGSWITSDRNLIIPTYPNGADVNIGRYAELNNPDFYNESVPKIDVTELKNRRDLAYAVQTESQQACLNLILQAVEKSKIKKVVFSGGYGLNCVANYFYLDELKKHNIEFYVEPVSNDAGTAMGAALLCYHKLTQDSKIRPYAESIYLGPKYEYNLDYITNLVDKFNGIIIDADNKDVVSLLTEKNIVSIFQGRSENGPRALGNRSILFDPTFKDGKDYVNRVKNREYFRPFAGSVLAEHAHDWFDMRTLKESPHMMYAVKCKDTHIEKIPSIVHVDGTCRIQTVTEKQNPLYYSLIKEFYQKTNIPILFNTSFNLGGEPLVETLEDALETLFSSDIEYLFLPEFKKIIYIKND
jgi:carbamoyltransferase